MPKITQVDKSACKTVAAAALQRLEQVAEELGMTVKAAGGARYSPETGTIELKIAFTCKEIGGVEQEQVAFERLCPQYGLKPSHYKAKFTVRGETFELVGFSPRRSKFALISRAVGSGRVTNYAIDALRLIDMEAYYHCEPHKRPREIDPELAAAKKGLV